MTWTDDEIAALAARVEENTLRSLAKIVACRCCEGRLDYPDEIADSLCRWCADPSYREVRSD